MSTEPLSLEERREILDKYISEVPELLAKHEQNNNVKIQCIERLGIGVHNHTDTKSKHVDWAMFGKVFSLNVEHQPRFGFDVTGKASPTHHT